MYTTCMPETHRNQKKVSHPLELELPVVNVPYKGWKLNLSPPQEQQALFSTEPDPGLVRPNIAHTASVLVCFMLLTIKNNLERKEHISSSR